MSRIKSQTQQTIRLLQTSGDNISSISRCFLATASWTIIFSRPYTVHPGTPARTVFDTAQIDSISQPKPFSITTPFRGPIARIFCTFDVCTQETFNCVEPQQQDIDHLAVSPRYKLSIKGQVVSSTQFSPPRACGCKAFAQWFQHVKVFFKPAGWHHAPKKAQKSFRNAEWFTISIWISSSTGWLNLPQPWMASLEPNDCGTPRGAIQEGLSIVFWVATCISLSSVGSTSGSPIFSQPKHWTQLTKKAHVSCQCWKILCPATSVSTTMMQILMAMITPMIVLRESGEAALCTIPQKNEIPGVILILNLNKLWSADAFCIRWVSRTSARAPILRPGSWHEKLEQLKQLREKEKILTQEGDKQLGLQDTLTQ